MTSTVEIIGLPGKLGGPRTIKINGTEITNVESYELHHTENCLHKFSITFFVNDLQIREKNEQEKLSI